MSALPDHVVAQETTIAPPDVDDRKSMETGSHGSTTLISPMVPVIAVQQRDDTLSQSLTRESPEAAEWRKTWSFEAMSGAIGGTWRVETAEEVKLMTQVSKLEKAAKKAIEKNDPDEAVRLRKQVKETNEQRALLKQRYEPQRQAELLELLTVLNDPRKSAQDGLAFAKDWADKRGLKEVGFIKRVSEICVAKALWFGQRMRLEAGDPSTGQGSGDKSPDYAGRDYIGDNFRIEGVKVGQEQRLLPSPDPNEHGPRMEAVRRAVVIALKDKLKKYAEFADKRRVFITAEITDCPWLLGGEHVTEILTAAEAELKKVPVDLWFVVGNDAKQVWKG